MAMSQINSLIAMFDSQVINEEPLSLVDTLFGTNWKTHKRKALSNHATDFESDYKFVKMVAPMVRYSKLPFRMLCRKWGADLCFTPMIIADSFNRSAKARDSSMTTSKYDRPLMVQFASNNPITFAQSSLKVMRYCDGVDLNCGCPQSWCIREQLGASLIQKPQLIKDMIYETTKLTQGRLPISFKIRIHSDIRNTIDLVQQIQAINDSIGANPFDCNTNNVCISPDDVTTIYNTRNVGGVSWLTVHGRTLSERTKVKVHLDHIHTIVQHANIPVIANGDINTPSDVMKSIKATGAQGVMCARGILSNPAMYSGYDTCPMECITDYLSLAMQFEGRFNIHHHHLMYMLKPYLTKSEQRDFNTRKSMVSLIDFMSERDWISDNFHDWNVTVPDDIFAQ
eukprot:205347_1